MDCGTGCSGGETWKETTDGVAPSSPPTFFMLHGEDVKPMFILPLVLP